jgi:hypothetical protein
MISAAIKPKRCKTRASANGEEISGRWAYLVQLNHTRTLQVSKVRHEHRHRNPPGGRTLGRCTDVQGKDRKVDYAQVLRPIDLQITRHHAKVSKGVVGLRAPSD